MTEADFRSTSSSNEHISAQLFRKESRRDCFVLFSSTASSLQPAVSGVWPRHTTRNRLVLPFIIHLVTVRKHVTNVRLATMYGVVQSDILCATADTSGSIVWLTGKNELFISLMSCSGRAVWPSCLFYFWKKKKMDKRAETQRVERPQLELIRHMNVWWGDSQRGSEWGSIRSRPSLKFTGWKSFLEIPSRLKRPRSWNVSRRLSCCPIFTVI